ncbi:MAG: Ig-like domain-containing protein [Gudongella sp.]|nr:Ig-like domain-containing protein [Gudongella sp.]
MIGRRFKRTLSIFVVLIMLLIAIGPAAYAAKPGTNTPVDITTEDFTITLTQGQNYQFEVVARYGSSKTLTWDDSSDNLEKISSKSAGIQEKVIYEYIAGDSTETATITVSDGSSTDSLTATFIVEGGTPDNNPPTVGDLTLTTDEDTPVEGTLIASDPDGDVLTAQITENPSNGNAEVNGLKVTYTPDQDYNGSDSFQVTVSDGNGGSARATVSITINPVDDPPVAFNDIAITDVNTAVDVHVLSNDTDIDGGQMYIESVSSASNGTLINNSSYVTYTPNNDFVGTDIFTYTLNGDSTATVTITVNPLAIEPIKYVALGDSIPYGTYYSSFWNYLGGGTDTYSYVEQFADYLNVEGGNFVDASVSGHNTVDVLNQINQMSTSISTADVITLCVGANDIMDAASRGWSGLNKYDIDWSVADAGRDNFEAYWPQVIDRIEYLNPDVTLIVMTVYNPYHEDESIYDRVDAYFSSSSGDMGLNYIIENFEDLEDTKWGDLLDEDFDYRVVGIYDAFNAHSNKDSLTGFYKSFCDPHPNQSGQDLIFSEHSLLY